ncbi:hypothetical protein [Roseicella aerolata]|uniref:Uncharacterized protein n=1 Tax=Roseicella aerolata TaxID=2883479 RepID=A0A9X1IGL5_9PROT|nr:hypothetical protein [Roseicella aerolata]MCB4822695.1 hypothetical protein [Roseicella aerolata]
MYAIAFDLDQEALRNHYPGANPNNAYGDIARVLTERGFWRQQGSVYFSNNPNPVQCFLAIQDVQAKHPWFRAVVRDMRMLRIEENNDLLPILGQSELPLGRPPRKRPDVGEFKLN